MIGTYYIPQPTFSEIGAVMETSPYKSYKRDEKRDREEKKKKKPAFKNILDKEVEKEPGQMGCFFEAKA